jgi:opacity protein-like surface antigen
MKLTFYLFVCTIFCGANLMAQSNDMGFLFGFSQRNASLQNDVIKGEVRLSFQFNPARVIKEVKEGRAGRFYAEVPIMVAAGLNGKIDENVTGRIGAVVFVTPGLRYEYNLTPHLSVYFGGGFGFAAARRRIGVPNGDQILTTRNTYWSAAGNYGGGVDVRLTDRWSLRAEARDFRARSETKIPGRNLGVLVGFAFRF